MMIGRNLLLALFFKIALCSLKLQHLSWSAQLLDLNIIEISLLAILKSRVSDSFNISFKHLEDVLEKWYKIALVIIQAFYDSIPTRIEFILEINNGPTSY